MRSIEPGRPMSSNESSCARPSVSFGRKGCRCTDCRRTPLTGERVYHYEGGRTVCELCRRCAARAARAVRRAACTGRRARPPRKVAARHSPAAVAYTPPRVDPVSVSVVVARPREEVFEYLGDIANHSEFTDHYLMDWHLTREQSYGRGAGARFRVEAPLNRFPWGDVDVHGGRAPVPHRRGGPRRQVQPHPHPRRLRR